MMRVGIRPNSPAHGTRNPRPKWDLTKPPLSNAALNAFTRLRFQAVDGSPEEIVEGKKAIMKRFLSGKDKQEWKGFTIVRTTPGLYTIESFKEFSTDLEGFVGNLTDIEKAINQWMVNYKLEGNKGYEGRSQKVPKAMAEVLNVIEEGYESSRGEPYKRDVKEAIDLSFGHIGHRYKKKCSWKKIAEGLINTGDSRWTIHSIRHFHKFISSYKYTDKEAYRNIRIDILGE